MLGGDSDDDLWLTEDDEIVSDSDSMPGLIEIDMSTVWISRASKRPTSIIR